MACEDCPLRGQRVVPADGSPSSKIMLVGEAPGEHEDKSGKPFIGAAGQFLNKMLTKVGLSREDLYITNVVKCRPPGNKLSKKHFKACLPKFIEEVQRVHPLFILAVGNTALEALTGHSGITRYRGQVIPCKHLPEAKVFPTLHPASALYSPANAPLIEQDFSTFLGLASGTWESASAEVNFVEVKPRNYGILFYRLAVAEAIAYDLETETATGKPTMDWKDPSNRIGVMGIAILSKKQVYVYVVTEFNERFWSTIRPYFEKPLPIKIAQNGKFDNHWLKRHGIKPYLHFDTMIAAYLIDENMPHGLEYLATSMLKVPPWKSKAGEDLVLYNAKDVYYTMRLWPVLEARLATLPRCYKLFYELDMPFARCAEAIEDRGIWLDTERMKGVSYDLELEKGEAETVLTGFLPPRENVEWWKKAGEINYNPSKFLSSVAFDHLSMPVLVRTDKGAPSLGKEALVQYADLHPFFPALSEYRRREKQLTFFRSWDELKVRGSDGWRLYPSYNVAKVPRNDGTEAGTVTGRISAENPNVQQVPREGAVRSVLGAPPGWKLIIADYSQIEIRIAAVVFNEPTMIEAYKKGEDLHALTAATVANIPLTAVTKEQRQRAKAVNFGFLYGMMAKTFKTYALLSYKTQMSLPEAERARRAYFHRYARLEAGHNRVKKVAGVLQQVTTLLGRVRHLPDIKSPDWGIKAGAERQALNAPVQGTAGEMCKLAIVELEQVADAREFRIVTTVHDSIIAEVLEGKEEKWAAIMKQKMEHLPLEQFGCKLPVPIVADITISKYWGE